MEKKHLHILWTNADLLTSEKMVMMYATNARKKGWWDEVTVIIWGATAKLVAENEMIQELIKIAQEQGVKFSACLACAEQLGVVPQLEKQDIELIYWGQGLTDLIMSDAKLLSV